VGHKRGVAAYCAKGPHWRVDASGEKSFSAKLQLAGADECSGHSSSIGGEREAVRA
jgi:hypothetical protein